MEVRFSPLFFILIGRCANVLHEKLSRTPLSPCDLFLFLKIRRKLKCERFSSIQKIQAAVTVAVRRIPVLDF